MSSESRVCIADLVGLAYTCMWNGTSTVCSNVYRITHNTATHSGFQLGGGVYFSSILGNFRRPFSSHHPLVKHAKVHQWPRKPCSTFRGATTAKKFRGTEVWVPKPGSPVPGQRPGWVLGAGGGRLLLLWGSGSITPGKFLNTQMLNPAFWWLLAVKFPAFWKLRPRSWGPIHCWFPNLKVGGPVSPSPYGCGAYGYFPDITECHSLGCFKHRPPVYKPVFAEFRGVAPVRLLNTPL